jgi:hypothetical protein
MQHVFAMLSRILDRHAGLHETINLCPTKMNHEDPDLQCMRLQRSYALPHQQISLASDETRAPIATSLT